VGTETVPTLRGLAIQHHAYDYATDALYFVQHILRPYCEIGMVFFPHAAPSTGAFERISPLGAPQGCGALPKGQEPLSATPFKSEERRE